MWNYDFFKKVGKDNRLHNISSDQQMLINSQTPYKRFLVLLNRLLAYKPTRLSFAYNLLLFI